MIESIDPILLVILILCGLVCFVVGVVVGVMFVSTAEDDADEIKKCETYEDIVKKES